MYMYVWNGRQVCGYQPFSFALLDGVCDVCVFLFLSVDLYGDQSIRVNIGTEGQAEQKVKQTELYPPKN